MQFRNSTQHSIRNIPLLLRGSHFFLVAIPKGILIQHQYNKDDIDHKWYNWAFSYRRNTRPTEGHQWNDGHKNGGVRQRGGRHH